MSKVKTSFASPFEFLSELVRRDIQRYKFRGPHALFIATSLLIAIALTVPRFAQWIWPKTLDFMAFYELREWQFMFGFTLVWNILVFSAINLVYYVIYKLEHPFFEQFKCQKDEKWPWKEDPKAWRELLSKTFKVVAFNNFVLLPGVMMFGIIADNY